MIIKTLNLQYLNNATLMQDDDDNTIVWCTHDKDYHFGSYYLIDKEGNVFYVIEKETEVREILLK